MIEAILQYLFPEHRDGSGGYVHHAPLMVKLLKQHPDKVKLEYLGDNQEVIRAWTPDGYEKYVINRPIKQAVDVKAILNENTKQMMLAIESGDVKQILELRKQIRELGN